MKNLIHGIIATVLFGFVGNAQSNNPQNQFGIDILKVSKVIADDYIAGKFTQLNQEKLDYYFSTYLPNSPRATIEMYNDIFSTYTKSTNETGIANSGFSATGQDFVKRSLTTTNISSLVDEVNASSINSVEKENILRSISLKYNLSSFLASKGKMIKSNQRGPSVDYDFSSFQNLQHNSFLNTNGGDDGSGFAIFGSIGSLIGFAIGGPVGAFIGGCVGVAFEIIRRSS